MRPWAERPSVPVTDHPPRVRPDPVPRASVNLQQSRNFDPAFTRNEYYGQHTPHNDLPPRSSVGVSHGKEHHKAYGFRNPEEKTRTSSFRPNARLRHVYDTIRPSEDDAIPALYNQKTGKKFRTESETAPGYRTVSRGSRVSELSRKSGLDPPNMLLPKVAVQQKGSKSIQLAKNTSSNIGNAFKELANLAASHSSASLTQQSFLTANSADLGSQFSTSTKTGGLRTSKTSAENIRPDSQEPRAPYPDVMVPQLSLNAGAQPKTLSLMPARSSTFLFAGREAFYSVNTTNGMIRTYNEDRVSIVINIKRKPDWKAQRWPNCAYFSIFDGHGGSLCADFLKDNLHKFILDSPHFPDNPVAAIEEGCAQAEHDFCKFALKQTNIEKSGSCGIVVLLIDDKAYIGNVGDSRAIVSENAGKMTLNLTRDHKPEDPKEKERIERAGGKVMKNNYLETYKFLMPMLNTRLTELPYRLYPGGLSVSRSFGDITAKDASLGGNPQVLIAKPDVYIYTIEKKTDFIFIGCGLTRRRHL